MSKPFDATLRALFEADPAAWLACAGLVADGPVRPIDTDLSTITSEADAAVLVEGPVPWIVHFEFQVSADPSLARRLLRYNALLGYREGHPVRSVVILLRPRADARDLTGVFRESLPDGSPVFEFHYRILRVWERGADEFLSGNLASLPLAPIADVPESSLPEVIRRMKARIEAEASPELAGKLWTATNVLMGLNFAESFIEALLKGVRDMQESSTYRAIVARGESIGRFKEAKSLLLRLGNRRFGPPDQGVNASIDSMTDIDRIERMSERLFDAAGWDDLLATP